MSMIKQLEAERRSLVTKVAYAALKANVDPKDRERLNVLNEELLKLSAADFYVHSKSASNSAAA